MLTFFIGSYTEYPIPGFGGIGHGIYTVQLNTETGELSVVQTKYSRNPSYLAISNDNKFLYCSTELDERDNPMVKAYKVRDGFSLEFQNEQPISGGYPCHIITYNTNVLVACYATGNVLQFPLDESGNLLECKKNYQHEGSSINEARQEAPHAHQVTVHPKTGDIYVCDLGIDTIKAYHFQTVEFIPNEKNDCTVTKGGGPRHMVFSADGSIAYVINELTGDISVIQDNNNTFEEVSNYSSLTSDFKDVPSSSALRIHPNGQFLYAANRKLEAVTVFSISGTQLNLVDHQFTGGSELREFNITPDGQWLVACHQNSHDTIVYKIHEDGRLQETYRTKDIRSPVCVVFPR